MGIVRQPLPRQHAALRITSTGLRLGPARRLVYPVPDVGEEAQFNPQVPALGQQLPAAQEGASLRLGLCVTVAKVLNRCVKWF